MAHTPGVLASPPSTTLARKDVGRGPHCVWRRSQYTNSTIRFRHYDWLGSSRFESNMTEKEYGDVAYAPFGETYSILNTPYVSFTGQQQDTVSGLADFSAREYNPTQGRWISLDPAGSKVADPRNPQSWNRYAYVLNDPLSNTDPSGLDCVYVSSTAPTNTNGMDSLGDVGVVPGIPFYIVPGDGDCSGDNAFYFDGTVSPDSVTIADNGDVFAKVIGGNVECSGECPSPSVTTTAQFTSVEQISLPLPSNNIPSVSQFRPPKPTSYVTGFPTPYKPTIIDCVTGPNDAAAKLLANSDENEHDPQNGMALFKSSYQDTSRGNNPIIEAETVETADSGAVFFAGFFNWVGCMFNTK
jgi:RHS repeat-associated protein